MVSATTETPTVRAGDFEGPIDVLLRLVTTSELDIYEIALTDIVNAFCAQVEQLSGPENLGPANLDWENLDRITQFLVPAAILVELKSRQLLPVRTPELDLEAELAVYGERDLSLARLIEGHTFTAAARRLRQLVLDAAQHHARQSGPDERFAIAAPDPLKGVAPADIAAALRTALARPPDPMVDISHIAAPPLTVKQCAYELVKQLPDSGPISFRELTEHITERVIVVAHFLALLELFKLGYVDLSQLERFGDIEIAWLSGHGEIDLSELDFDVGLASNGAAANGAAAAANGAGAAA